MHAPEWRNLFGDGTGLTPKQRREKVDAYYQEKRFKELEEKLVDAEFHRVRQKILDSLIEHPNTNETEQGRSS